MNCQCPAMELTKWAGIHPRKGEGIRLPVWAGSVKRPVSDRGGDRGRRGGQVTTDTGAPAPGLAPDDAGPVWHTLSADGVLQAEDVDERSGLSSAEAAARAERFGPNKFDAGKSEPRWRAFLRQFADLMQIVLLVAGVVSLALQEWETGIVLVVLTLFNAVLGLQQ